jgi:heterodisulfide reductase subunit A
MTKTGGKIIFDRQRCRSLQGLECERCVTVCPTGAIDLFGEEHLSVNGDVVVVATGALEFPAEKDVRLGYGVVPGVITSMELESFLEGRSAMDIGAGSRLAFLLCVGSRTCREGTPMCSSVCCKYALRQALSLKEKHPSIGITMFVMDWRGMSEDDPLLKELEGTDIKVLRSRPAEIFAEEGRPTVRYAFDGSIGCERFDQVVLAVGLVPDVDDELAGQLALARGTFGNLEPRNCRERGIFLAGSCLEPKDIRHCVIDGILAAKNALNLLEEEHD